MKTTYTYIITRKDGSIDPIKFENQEDDRAAFSKLLRIQGNSIDYALRYSHNVEVINEQTKESNFWEPYTK